MLGCIFGVWSRFCGSCFCHDGGEGDREACRSLRFPFRVELGKSNAVEPERAACRC